MNTLQDTLSTLHPGPRLMAEQVMEKARDMFNRKGGVDQAVFVLNKDGDEVECAEIPCFNDDTRPAIWAAMEKIRSEYPVVGFISEVWMAECKKGDYDPKTTPRPSEHPDRVEKLMFNLWHNDRTLIFVAAIKRNPDALEPWEVMYDNYFPQGKFGKCELEGGMVGKKRYPAAGN